MEKYYSEIRRQLEKYNNVQSLMRYINEETIKEKHKQLDRNKATGVDKVTKAEYEEELNKAINEFVTKINDILGDRVKKIILYGSYARRRF